MERCQPRGCCGRALGRRGGTPRGAYAELGRLAEVGEHVDTHDLRLNAEVVEQLDGHVALGVEQAEEYVLHADVRVAEGKSISPGAFEGTFRPRHEVQMTGQL